MIADLYAGLRLKTDKGSFDRGNKSISSIKSALLGVGAFFGARMLGKALIGFNAGVEETKNQIAGMLALSKKTNLTDELANADTLFSHLQKRAATLPGTTEEYAKMLGMLTQPLTAAGASMQELEDLTVNSVIAAKGLGVPWEAAARDIDQALRGTFRSVDVLTGKLLAPMGFVGEAGRKKFNALSKERRLAVVKEALTQKQIVQLGEVQGKTFSGVMSTLQDAVQRFVGAVGIPLFKALSEQIQKLNKWVGENQVKLAAVAATIGDVLLGAFQAIIASVQYFMDHGDEFLAILIAIGSVITGFAVAWAISFAPIIAIIALIAALVFVVIKIVRNWDLIKSKGVAAWNAVKKAASDAWEFIKDIPSKILDGFEALGNGIISTLGKAFDWIVQQAKDLPGKILDHLRKIPGFGAIESAANIVAGGIPVAGGGVAAEAISRVQESQAPAGAVSTVNIGDINVTAPIGADAKEHADIIKTHITKHLESEYRRSAP